MLELPSWEVVPDSLRQFSELRDSVLASAIDELANLSHMPSLHHTFDHRYEGVFDVLADCMSGGDLT